MTTININDYTATDIRAAKRFATIKLNHLDRSSMTDGEIVDAALNAGWVSGRAPAPAPAPTPAPAPATTDAQAKALQALLDTLTPAPALDVEAVKALIKEHSVTVTTLVIDNKPAATKVAIKGAHKQLKRIVKRLDAGYNVYLYGPAGSGKTTLARQAAEALDIPFYFTGSLLQKYELTGYNDAGGNYVATTFHKAYSEGGLYLFDEIDSSNPSAVIAFNMAIENGRMAFPNGDVEMHKDFRCIAAANTAGMGATVNYKRQALDGATLDRFSRIELNYDEALETRLALAEYARLGGEDTTQAEAWIKMVQSARKQATDKRIDVIISPRSSIRGCGILAMGDSHKDAINETFGASLSADQRKQLDLGAK